MERVGFYARVGAWMIDVFLLALVVHLAMLVDVVVNRETDVISFGAITGGASGAMLALGIALETLGPGSVGKRALGLEIAGDDGAPATLGARARRAGMKFAPLILVFFPAAAFVPTFSADNPYGIRDVEREGLLVLAWVDVVVTAAIAGFVITGCFRVLCPQRQAFHDQFAGTAVFRRADLRARHGFIPMLKRADSASAAAGEDLGKQEPPLTASTGAPGEADR